MLFFSLQPMSGGDSERNRVGETSIELKELDPKAEAKDEKVQEGGCLDFFKKGNYLKSELRTTWQL